ncbi:hypothetical protein IE53DRAFT_383273 [Violaceomyces palustris]|uniref:Uncharacterized protein n=1 Tax=Violaceomyces palustris TaxID=1673888 RepID=A0ACD0P7T7_9BASI|nr:hypothetical protein IE53DRAFT_383273 [Violaceomyces palustris]
MTTNSSTHDTLLQREAQQQQNQPLMKSSEEAAAVSTGQPDTTTPSFRPPPSVVRPGKDPLGPPGWEEKRIRQETEMAKERRSSGGGSGGVSLIKEKIYNLGERMHLVEPKDPDSQTDAQRQNASTTPME